MFGALTLLSLAFAVGVAAGEWLGVGVPVAGLLAGAASLLLILARRRDMHVGAISIGQVLLLGVLAVAGARREPPPGLVDGAQWVVYGEVVAAPERSASGARLAIDLSAVERDAQRREAQARVSVFLDAPPTELLLPGDVVRVPLRLHPPRGFLNPGAPDARRRAAAEGVVAVAGAKAGALSRLAQPVRWSVARTIALWRARMLSAVAERLHGDAEALVASLVLGDRGDVPQSLEDAFRAAGVSHVLSVSGLHLAVAAFLFYVGLRRLLACWPRLAEARPLHPWAAAAAVPAVIAYTLLTGAAVATVRSCIVAVVWLAAVASNRRTSTLQAMAVAALLILAMSPLELFDPSFQLSFAAAAGTGLLAPRWSPAGGGGQGRLRRLGLWTWRLAAASAAAIMATAPIAAWHFAQLAPLGVLSNLVVVPLAELGIVPVGLAGCVAASLHMPGAGALLQVAGWLAVMLARFTVWFARVAPAWHVPAPNLVEIVTWYAALLAIVRQGRRAWRWVLPCGLLFVASATMREVLRATSQTLRATFLDVGQGDACVVELPHGRVMVVDGGGTFDPSFDPGRQVIAPFLWRRGIRRIDLMVLSHPHPDHANGLATLVEQFPVGALWTNGQDTSQPGTVALLAAAQRHAVPAPLPRTLDLGGAQVVPLAPFDDSGALSVDAARSENDNSLVVAVGWRGRRLLFAGDVEAEGEAALVARAGADARADIVKVPHHGSRTSSTAALVAATHPSLAVISVGERNRWGFPNGAVVARWQAAGARVRRTDRDGAVTVTVDPHGRVDVEEAR